jgi:hypothetical protein
MVFYVGKAPTCKDYGTIFMHLDCKGSPKSKREQKRQKRQN